MLIPDQLHGWFRYLLWVTHEWRWTWRLSFDVIVIHNLSNILCKGRTYFFCTFYKECVWKKKFIVLRWSILLKKYAIHFYILCNMVNVLIFSMDWVFFLEREKLCLYLKENLSSFMCIAGSTVVLVKLAIVMWFMW